MATPLDVYTCGIIRQLGILKHPPDTACHVQELSGLAEADVPKAGMFLWIRLLGVDDSRSLRELFKQEKVVVVPGDARGSSPIQ